MRDDIAVSLPKIMKAEALALRNRLLAWRFAAHRDAVIDPTRAVEGLSPRGNQMALSLLSLIDDAALRERIGSDLLAGEARVATKRAASPEATMVRVLAKLFESAPSYLPLSAVTSAYNEEAAGRGDSPISVKSAGCLVRGRLGIDTTKTRGVYVIPQSERSKVEALAARCSP